jgi:N-acyl-phosphatidylethanolamine-hydrolysing phospholipase D
MGPKRFTPAACKPGHFPTLDAVFISHNHHDHLSYTGVKEIVRMYQRVYFFVGLGLAKWFHDSSITAVTEMDWWDDAEVILENTTSSMISSDDVKSDDGDESITRTGPSSECISARISWLPS